jgi:hypothetical protein
MAKVTSRHREKTRRRTGSGKYPMETASQVRSAIKLRHHGKGISASTVLSRASSAITRLLRTKKISATTAKALRAKVSAARAKDKK